MNVYAISTLRDWAHFCGTAGPVGMERVFDRLTMARVKRVYWRLLEGGVATYPSKIAPVFDARNTQARINFDIGDGGGPSSRHFHRLIECKSWDPLATAVEIGKRRGIEVFAWWTICEEDHGGAYLSKFGHRADLQLQDRQGKSYPGTIDFFFEEVQQYKIKILEEALARNVDGVLLDFARHNATPSGDDQGVHRFGYNPEIRQAFKNQHGSDPLDLPDDDADWLAFKNGYRADFVRVIRAKMPKDTSLDLMTPPNFDQYRWLCLDLPTLSRQGVVDLVMPFSMTYCSSPQSTKRDIEALRSQVRGRKTEVAGGFQAYWGVDEDHFQKAVVAAREAKAKTVVLYEAHHLGGGVYQTAVRAANLGAMPIDRSVTVKRLPRVPTSRDWDRAETHKDFYVAAGVDQLMPTATTSFSVLVSDKALHVRMIAMGKQGQIDPEKLAIRQTFIDTLGARNYWMMADKAHLFVDPGSTRRDFCHFSVARLGEMMQEQRHDNEWSPPWDAEVAQVSEDRWEAYWHIPFATLGGKPKSGDRWGFQIAREQNPTREGSTWFVSTAYGHDPAEWGDMVFR